jgi:hypothetical protein
MTSVILSLTFALTSVGQTPPGTSREAEAYETARVAAGQDPEKLVRLALWCEAHGRDKDRQTLLGEIVRIDPENPLAHTLLGLVRTGDGWLSPDMMRLRRQADEPLKVRLAEYLRRRDRLVRLAREETAEIDAVRKRGASNQVLLLKLRLDHKLAEEHAHLARWCKEHDLEARSLAHDSAAVRLNPALETARKHLRYVNHDGRWITREQLESTRREAEAQRHADRLWESRIRRLARALRSSEHVREAEAELAKMTDPASVPTIARLLARGSADYQRLAVRLLGPIDSPASTHELASLAIFGDDPTRLAAIDALRGRDPLDYAGTLVALIRTPCTFDVRPGNGGGTVGALIVDTPRFHLDRRYSAFAVRIQDFLSSGGYVGYDPYGGFVMMTGRDFQYTAQHMMDGDRQDILRANQRIREGEGLATDLVARANLSQQVQRARMAQDIQVLQLFNGRASFLNPRVRAVLEATLDAPGTLGDDEDAWHAWFYDRIGYRYVPSPKVSIFGDQRPRPLPASLENCFAADTPVRTVDGPKPIQSLGTGDLVLSLDVASATLRFEPVIMVRRNRPEIPLRLDLDGGERVEVSQYHRFWKAGHGWTLARDLKVGDRLRSSAGLRRIAELGPARLQPTYSIDVSGSRTYFAGTSEILVHDSTLPQSHGVSAPYDRFPEPGPNR